MESTGHDEQYQGRRGQRLELALKVRRWKWTVSGHTSLLANKGPCPPEGTCMTKVIF